MNLIFSDLHLNEERLGDQQRILETILKVDCERIFFLGDMFSNRKHIPSVLHKVVTNFVERRGDKEMIFMAGNHDKPSDKAKYSAFRPYRGWDEVVVVETKPYVRNNMMFLPFLPEKMLIETLKNYKLESFIRDNIAYLFIHQGLSGVPFDSGKMTKSKLTFKMFKEFLPGLKKIFSGHYHTRKEYFDGNVYYVGNPLALSHSEEVIKGYHLFDEKTDKLKFYQLDAPRFVTLRLSCNGKAYARAVEFIKHNENNFVRLIFIDRIEKFSSIPKDYLYERARLCRQLKIETHTLETKSAGDAGELVFQDDILDIYKDYAKEEKFTKEENKFGKEILQECLNE